MPIEALAPSMGGEVSSKPQGQYVQSINSGAYPVPTIGSRDIQIGKRCDHESGN